MPLDNFDIHVSGFPGPQGGKGAKGDAGERPVYATWSALSAVTGTAGASAEVPDSDTGTHADPVTAATVANGGIYSWSMSPAGWQRVADTDALSAKPYADAAATSAANAASSANAAAASAASAAGVTDLLNATETIGRPVASPPVTGSALSANTYIFATPAAHDGTIETVRLWGLAAGTIKLRVFDRSGDTFTQSGTDANLAVTAGAGLKTISTSLPVLAGQYVGFYAPANVVAYNGATADGGGWYAPSVAADSTSFTDATPTTTPRIEMGVDISYQAVTAAHSAQQDASIASNTATVADNTNRLGVTEGSNLTQIIGRQPDPVTGLTTTSGTYVFFDRIIGNGRIKQIKVFALGTGVIKVRIFTTASDVHTQVGTDTLLNVVAGLNTFTVNIPVVKGQRIGFYNSTVNAVTRAAATGDSGGYYALTGDVTTGSGALSTGSLLQIGFTLDVDAPQSFPVDIRNSDRIIVLGDSFTESDYTQRGKSWLAKVSLFSDWAFDNFAKSGDKMSDNLTRLRSDILTLGVLPFRRRFGTYALFYIGQNDKAAISLSSFVENMRQGIETVKGLGLTPIIVSQHSKDVDHYGLGFSLIYRNLAEEYGGYFVNVTEWARVNDYGTRYAGFWNGTHPGVRTNAIIAEPIQKLIDSLDGPRQSIKIFRKRANVTVSTVADLIFNSHYERAKLFKEILIGTGAPTVANEKYYDEANTIGALQMELVNSEYETLQNGGTIALGDYSLIEVTLPVLAKHLDQLDITLSDATAAVYCRNILGNLTANLPVGSWEQIAGNNGTYKLSNSQLQRYMREDKLSLLVNKAGGIAAFSTPMVKWTGSPVQKPPRVTKTLGRSVVGSELLANPDAGVATSWTSTGTITRGAPADGCLPYGSTGRVTVDNANYISQALSYPVDNTKSREIEIRVNARYFPAIFASTGDYSTAPITQDSFDWARIQLELVTPGGAVPYHERVGTWWGDIVLRTIAPLGTTGLTLNIKAASGSPEIEVAKASVRFVDG